jgi:hypothetical protein
MTITILQYGLGAVYFDHFSSREENSYAFFRRPWRAELRHRMLIVGLMLT